MSRDDVTVTPEEMAQAIENAQTAVFRDPPWSPNARAFLALLADRDALRAELDLVHGAIRADDERLYAAWVRIHGAPDDCANIACDAFEWMADEILRLRAELERTKGELERVRGLLMVALPHVEASAGAQHLMDGFRPRKRPLDDAVEEIRAALERKAVA